MYNIFYRGSLITVGVGTVLGVAAMWIPDAWHDVAWRLFYSDVVMFVGAIAGSVISYYGRQYNDQIVTAEVVAKDPK
jgi:hypothetical protein